MISFLPFVTLFALSSLFSLFSSITAVPVERRAIDPSLFTTLNLYEQYAAASYCPDNNDSPNTKILCTPDNCPLVEAANTDSIIEFQNTAGTDTTGYLATDTTNSLIVLSFRGSESLRNYISDVTFPLVPTDICDGCEAEAGFWASWLSARDIVTTAVKSTAAANPTFKIVTTGHSLGGAVATFAAAELRDQGYTVDLATYGSPRVGNTETATYITNQNMGANYRVTHLNDLVPRLPPTSFGYQHTSPEYWITSPNSVTPTPADVDVCSGIGNYDCNASYLVTDIEAHAWYFNEISECYPGDTIEVRRRGRRRV